jgi:protein-S-isoprenylcysteine O-methyltransferase Ste14
MAILVLVFLGSFLAIGLGLQGIRQYHRTGYSVVRGLYRRPLSKEWWIGECWVAGFVCIALGAVLDLCGLLQPLPGLPGTTRGVGVVVAVAGFAGTEWAVVAMGETWRVGVDESERTRLVTAGPFRFVRNPIYSFMVVLAAGLAVMVPVTVSWVGAALVTLGLELQVRVLEEPYLRRTHGEAWLHYASATGRFVPGVGRLASDGKNADCLPD